MIPPYNPQLVADLARQQHLPLPQERLEMVAATLTHVRNFIMKLETPSPNSSLNAKGSTDETA
ncbi:hypothetical protein [Nitratireductor sp. CH_MIT9313-5]|jgi:hypothetical protein|uniref:hypothetical protein n=1 Tax=Nitratireductor sp. CH_MIT9313-5 TaxID=3107764 RepID=UPI00300B7B9B